jgi:hypothetical protein
MDMFLLLSGQCFSVEEMQLYFSFLFHFADHFHGKQAPLIFPDIVLEALLTLSREEFVPNYYIDFPPCSSNDPNHLVRSLTGGKDEGYMEIPSVLFPTFTYGPWPPQKGYTTTAWFRIEKMQQISEDAISSSICLFSLSTHDQELLIDAVITHDMYFGVKLYVECGDDIEGDTTEKNNKYEVVFKYQKFERNKWYFIALNHNQTTVNNQIVNTFTLYVNGFPQGTCNIEYEDTSYLRILKNILNMNKAYLSTICLGCSIYNTISFLSQFKKPKTRKSTSFSFLGWNTVVDDGEKEKRQLFKTQAAFQMGNVYIIDECLSATDVYLIYHLGPNYIGTFENSAQYFTREIVNAKRQESVASEDPLKHLTDRVIIVFSARDGTVATRLSIHVMTNINIFEMSQQQPRRKRPDSIRLKKHTTFHDNVSSYIPTNRGDALAISKGITTFTPVKALLTGNSAVIFRSTFKSNLFTIGGMSTIMSLITKFDDVFMPVYELPLFCEKRETHKIIIMELLAYLTRYNAQNMSKL